MTEWHYEKDGQQRGPIPESEIKILVETGVIGTQTLVWATGFTAWTPLVETPLSAHLMQIRTPPALPSNKISHVVVWILAFAPIIGLLLKSFLVGVTADDPSSIDVSDVLRSGEFWYVTLILNIGLSMLDLRRLKQAGVDTKSFGKLVCIVPVYLWKRAKSLGQGSAYFWVWLVAFVLTQLAMA